MGEDCGVVDGEIEILTGELMTVCGRHLWTGRGGLALNRLMDSRIHGIRFYTKKYELPIHIRRNRLSARLLMNALFSLTEKRGGTYVKSRFNEAVVNTDA